AGPQAPALGPAAALRPLRAARLHRPRSLAGGRRRRIRHRAHDGARRPARLAGTQYRRHAGRGRGRPPALRARGGSGEAPVLRGAGAPARHARGGLRPPDPSGAGASRTDFGRAIADSGLLVLLACLGLITRMHETTAAAGQVGLVALFLLGVAWSLEHSRRGAVIAALAIAASVATRGIAPAVAMLVAWLLLPLISQPFRLVCRSTWTIGLPLAVAAGAAWPLALAGAGPEAREYLREWLAWNAVSTGWLPTVETLSYLARTAPWYYWPVWPLAAWAIVRWRSKLELPAIALPLATLGCLAIPAFFARSADEAELLPLIPPLAMLAAVGLPTLRRGMV